METFGIDVLLTTVIPFTTLSARERIDIAGRISGLGLTFRRTTYETVRESTCTRTEKGDVTVVELWDETPPRPAEKRRTLVLLADDGTTTVTRPRADGITARPVPAGPVGEERLGDGRTVLVADPRITTAVREAVPGSGSDGSEDVAPWTAVSASESLDHLVVRYPRTGQGCVVRTTGVGP